MPRTKNSAQFAPAKKKNIPEKSVEASLWESANKLRGSVEPSEYKHVVLSLIFLKFASDKFEEQRAKLVAEGKGKFYMLKTIVGLIYDPCCGSGGMFVQSN